MLVVVHMGRVRQLAVAGCVDSWSSHSICRVVYVSSGFCFFGQTAKEKNKQLLQILHWKNIKKILLESPCFLAPKTSLRPTYVYNGVRDCTRSFDCLKLELFCLVWNRKTSDVRKCVLIEKTSTLITSFRNLGIYLLIIYKMWKANNRPATKRANRLCVANFGET